MTISIGTTFTYPLGKDNKIWTVIKRTNRAIFECSVESNTQLFAEEVIKLAKRFEKSDWWSIVEIGSVVHYHNGFGQYVRGHIMTNEAGNKFIRPMALVGNWSNTDLPYRRLDGEIHIPYYALKVINKEPMNPPHNCIWECNSFNRNNYPDPTNMSNIDIMYPPELVGEQAIMAKFERTRQQIMDITRDELDPQIALVRIKELLEDI